FTPSDGSGRSTHLYCRRIHRVSSAQHRGLSGSVSAEIITQYPGQSAEEIERYVTIPVEIGMAGIPGLEHVRSISLYGLSSVKVQFSYDTDYYFALQQVLNRLNNLTLPNNVQPFISPESAVGEVFRYQLVGK